MKKNSIAAAAGSFLLLVSVLLTVIDLIAFCRPFYSFEYKRDHTASYIGMSDEDLMASTETLLDYLQDKRDGIVIEAEVRGSQREIFDERETLHMVDVKNLYQNALKARNIMFIAGVVLLAGACMASRGSIFPVLYKGYRNALIMIASVVAILLLYAVIDFYNFWMNFHYIFFNNDLFLLDPNVSIMINMFPEIFFRDMVLSIIFSYCAIAALIGFILRKKALA
jgi:integral membrane protein (TIGR01906 family)